MKVFIDGENFRHRLAGVLTQEGLLGDYDQPFDFDVPALLELALTEIPEQISYYTSRVKQPHFDVPQEMLESDRRHPGTQSPLDRDLNSTRALWLSKPVI